MINSAAQGIIPALRTGSVLQQSFQSRKSGQSGKSWFYFNNNNFFVCENVPASIL
jgi:hypothetical protein